MQKRIFPQILATIPTKIFCILAFILPIYPCDLSYPPFWYINIC